MKFFLQKSKVKFSLCLSVLFILLFFSFLIHEKNTVISTQKNELSIKDEKISSLSKLVDIKDSNIRTLKEKIENQTINLDRYKKDLAYAEIDSKLISVTKESNLVLLRRLIELEYSHNLQFISIYGVNIDNYATEIHSFSVLDNSLSLKEKLSNIASTLSDESFDSLPIEVIDLKDIDGKLVAFVNLQSSDRSNTLKDWSNNYFQGSCGGLMTSVTLSQSFLQPQYTGEWIDGVKFLYNGEDIDFQHTPDLFDIIYKTPSDSSDPISDYLPEIGTSLKFNGGFENGGSRVFYSKKEGDRFLLESNNTGEEFFYIYDICNNSLVLTYSNIASNISSIEAFKAAPNRNYVLLKEPLISGNSWFNGDEFSIITNTHKEISTPAGYFDCIEVTRFSSSNIKLSFFSKEVGLVKEKNISSRYNLIPHPVTALQELHIPDGGSK